MQMYCDKTTEYIITLFYWKLAQCLHFYHGNFDLDFHDWGLNYEVVGFGLRSYLSEMEHDLG